MSDFDIEKKKLEILKLQNENIKLQKEAEKLDEEKSKVQAEKEDILKPWYFKSSWWTVITTFLIGLGGFYVALQTNIFGIQDLKIRNEKLKDSIVLNQKELGIYQDSLRDSKLQYDNIRKSLETKLTYAEQDKLIKVNNLRRELIDQQIETFERFKSYAEVFYRPIDPPVYLKNLLKDSTNGANPSLDKFSDNLNKSNKLIINLSTIMIKSYDKKIDSLRQLRLSIKP